MTIEALPDVVYHGTIELNRTSLEKGIDLQYSKKYLDFGMGFYTTSNYEQAASFAIKRSMILGSKPVVISYNINKELLEHITMNCLLFDSPNEKWYEFVYNNRVKSEHMISDFHNKTGKYDVVYGYVADENIGLLTQKAQKKQIDFRFFVQAVKPFYGYNQLSFHTADSLNILTLSNIEAINNQKEVSLCSRRSRK